MMTTARPSPAKSQYNTLRQKSAVNKMPSPAKNLEPGLDGSQTGLKKHESLRKVDSMPDSLASFPVSTDGHVWVPSPPTAATPAAHRTPVPLTVITSAPTTEHSTGSSSPGASTGSPTATTFNDSSCPTSASTSLANPEPSSPGPGPAPGAPERKYSRSHNRRFHRRFPSVDCEERLINYYSCALIADILLQGYLYISEKYFAFYSNIFGYKTKLLIPIKDVVTVTKEKTAKFIPNAVGICTDEGKYVFGSLISRETTYRLMLDVWRTSAPLPVQFFKPTVGGPRESMDTGSESPCTPTTLEYPKRCGQFQVPLDMAAPPIIILPEDASGASFIMKSGSLTRVKNLSCPGKPLVSEQHSSDGISEGNSGTSDTESDMNSADEGSPGFRPRTFDRFSTTTRIRTTRVCSQIKDGCVTYVQSFTSRVKRAAKTPYLLIATTFLLVILLASACLLLYRLNKVHTKMTDVQVNLPLKGIFDKLKSAYLRLEIKRITEDLKDKLEQLVNFRESLSLLLTTIEELPSHCSPFSRNTQVRDPSSDASQSNQKCDLKT